jgi:hypothetical protein
LKVDERLLKMRADAEASSPSPSKTSNDSSESDRPHRREKEGETSTTELIDLNSFYYQKEFSSCRYFTSTFIHHN